jgi:preprotein translocase subunit SecA
MRVVEKQVMLQILDQRWKEHLATMDHLRQGIHLRAYAQKQPKQEYKRESFELFQELLFAIKRDVVRLLSRVEIERQDSVEELERRRREEAVKRMQFQHQQAATLNGSPDPQASGPGPDPAKPETFVRQERKVGRNESCPCGSGKKYKHCHGRAA